MWEKSRFDFYEEETKVRKNLSRLIHTLQHFPSNRSGLDTTSLGGLIEELESFNPDRKTKEMQFTQTTERKTYSKKYLNLRISGETQRPNGFGETHQKRQNKKTEYKYGNSNFTKDSQSPKPSNIYSCRSEKSKISNNAGMKLNKKLIKNEEVRGKIIEKSNSSKRYNIQRNNQQQSEHIIPKSKGKPNNLKGSENKMEYNTNLVHKKSKIYHSVKDRNLKFGIRNKIEAVREDSKSNKQNLLPRPNKPNRNQMTNYKCKSHQCTPKYDKALQQIILDNNQNSMDRSSVVKKLTNYWNKLLNNEFDQRSSRSTCSAASSQNVCIHDRLNTSDTLSENSNSALKSRHLSESNINIMKRVEDLQSKNCIGTESGLILTPLNQTNNTTDFEPANPSIKIVDGEHEVISVMVGDCNETHQCSFVSVEDAVQVLQKILNSLKSFPNCNIQPFDKKLLFIMVVSSMLKSEDGIFLQKVEIHVDKIIEDIIRRKKATEETNGSEQTETALSTTNKNLGTDMDFISMENEEKNVNSTDQEQTKSLIIRNHDSRSVDVVDDCCEITPDSQNALALTSRIDINKVKNSLNLYLMWREILRMKKLYDYDHDDNVFSNYVGQSFHSFTISFEEDIIFEEISDDESFTEEESNTIIGMFKSTAATIANYIKKLFDIFEKYSTESPESLLRMLYHALVSILIWWVLVQEIFLK